MQNRLEVQSWSWSHDDDGSDDDYDDDGEDGEDDGISVNVGKDHSIVIQELDAVPYYE